MKRPMWILLWLLPALLSPLAAQDVRITASVDSTRYLIGQWITVHLGVDAPASVRLHLPAGDDDVENGDFVSARDAEINGDGARRNYRQDIVTTVFDTGSIALRIRVRYRNADDTTMYEAFSNTLQLELATVELDTSQTFKDITDVIDVSRPLWEYLLYLAIALLAAAAVWYGYRRWKQRPAPPVADVAPPVPEIPPHVRALDALAALRAKRLWQNGEHKAYQSELTDILRTYIEERYRIPALEHPTSEIMPALTVTGLASTELERLARVLGTADMTKFARYVPTSMQHEEAMAGAEDFIHRTAAPAGNAWANIAPVPVGVRGGTDAAERIAAGEQGNAPGVLPIKNESGSDTPNNPHGGRDDV